MRSDGTSTRAIPNRADRSIPDFQGYGTLRAGSDGQFRIKTIKPPPYSGRTPHIHFIVAGGRTRLTTQMFFEGEALNDRDGLYRHLGADDRRALEPVATPSIGRAARKTGRSP